MATRAATLTCFTEANPTMIGIATIAFHNRAACPLHLFFNNACRCGDPTPLRRTIPFAEAARFAAIERRTLKC